MHISHLKIHLLWLVPLVVFDVFFFTWLWKKLDRQRSLPEPRGVEARISNPRFSFPTGRELDRFNTGNFQPTASGRTESALFGSVRTGWVGRKLMPTFHEGIDVAPLERDRAGHPLDDVIAAASGKIVYANRAAGNSNYGKYVVIEHRTRAGNIYTLYAHLDEIQPGISRGRVVGEGASLGKMGATSNGNIPTGSAHLHFEICLLLNTRFEAWFKKHKLTPDHGLFNGWNLLGIDPLAVYELQEDSPENEFDLSVLLAGMPRAFTLVLKSQHCIDFFRRYPELWQGPHWSGGVAVVACSDNGIPLSGRPATPHEAAALGRAGHAVISCDPKVIGRNGCRIVVYDCGKWRLGEEGRKWLSMLIH